MCLLYVCATVKIQFDNIILNHTHPLLCPYASLHVRAPLFENSGSAPGTYVKIEPHYEYNSSINQLYNQEIPMHTYSEQLKILCRNQLITPHVQLSHSYNIMETGSTRILL